jgi:hypothetical protein
MYDLNIYILNFTNIFKLYLIIYNSLIELCTAIKKMNN